LLHPFFLQTPRVSSVVVARVFLDPDIRLFDYDPEFLLSQQPDFNAFTNLEEIYTTIADKMSATVHLGNGVTHVERRSGRQPIVRCGIEGMENRCHQLPKIHPPTVVLRVTQVVVTDEQGVTREFDEIVFSCDADSAKKILGRGARYMEKFVLGNVRYFNDITVTHEDEAVRRKDERDKATHPSLLFRITHVLRAHSRIPPFSLALQYMEKYYEFDNERGDMYFVRTDPDDSEVLEMSFNLSNYQKQLEGTGRNVYQSIFLNDKIRERWTMDEIDRDKVRGKSGGWVVSVVAYCAVSRPTNPHFIIHVTDSS
jgi:hypothetical protein